MNTKHIRDFAWSLRSALTPKSRCSVVVGRGTNFWLSADPDKALRIADKRNAGFAGRITLQNDLIYPDTVTMLSPASLPSQGVAALAASAGLMPKLNEYCRVIAVTPKIFKLSGSRTEEAAALVIGENELMPASLKSLLDHRTIFVSSSFLGMPFTSSRFFLNLAHETGHLEFFDRYDSPLLSLVGTSFHRNIVRELYAYTAEWNTAVSLLDAGITADISDDREEIGQFRAMLQMTLDNIRFSGDFISKSHLDGHIQLGNIPVSIADGPIPAISLKISI